VNTSEESLPPPEQFQTTFNPARADVEDLSPRLFTLDNPPWGLWQAILTWVLSVILLLLLPLVFGLPYIMYYYQGVVTRETLLADKTFIFVNVFLNIPVHILTFLMAWAVITQLGRFQFREMIGWGWSPKLGFWRSAGLAVLLFGLALVLVLLFGGPETEVERIIQSSRATAFMLAFLAVATAPLVEETVYRGVMYPAFKRSIGMTGAIIVVSGLFAVGHVYQYWPNFGVISAIVLLSIALTLVRAVTGRLLPCFIIHLVFNGIQAVEIVLSPFIRTLDPGGEKKAAAIIFFLRQLPLLV
jgi:membrane protease YdiL (CAAX protease family)